MLETIFGGFVLALFLAILAVGYNAHMQSIYADIAHDEAEEIADDMFEEAIENAEIRVNQRLTIIDEMKGGRHGKD